MDDRDYVIQYLERCRENSVFSEEQYQLLLSKVGYVEAAISDAISKGLVVRDSDRFVVFVNDLCLYYLDADRNVFLNAYKKSPQYGFISEQQFFCSCWIKPVDIAFSGGAFRLKLKHLCELCASNEFYELGLGVTPNQLVSGDTSIDVNDVVYQFAMKYCADMIEVKPAASKNAVDNDVVANRCEPAITISAKSTIMQADFNSTTDDTIFSSIESADDMLIRVQTAYSDEFFEENLPYVCKELSRSVFTGVTYCDVTCSNCSVTCFDSIIQRFRKAGFEISFKKSADTASDTVVMHVECIPAIGEFDLSGNTEDALVALASTCSTGTLFYAIAAYSFTTLVPGLLKEAVTCVSNEIKKCTVNTKSIKVMKRRTVFGIYP